MDLENLKRKANEKYFPVVIQPPADSVETSWQDLAQCSNDQARQALDFSLAQKYCVLPISIVEDALEAKVLNIVIGGEVKPEILREIKFVCGFEVIAEAANYAMVEKAIFAAYKGTVRELEEALVKVKKQVFVNSELRQLKLEQSLINEAPVPKLLDALISRGISLRASDIHIEPKGEAFRVRYRVDGILQEEADFLIPLLHGQDLVRRIKVLSKLDLTESRHPQESGFTFASKEWSVRLRVSIVPQLYSAKVVIRLLDNHFLKNIFEQNGPRKAFDVLGLSSAQQQLLISCLESGRGVVLVSGPTGSGKSTLLYAALNYLNVEWRNIISIEDPIERIIPGVNQAELSIVPEISCNKLLSSMLRQDPDVVMIGEMRDRDTAITALEAGITGHLVLSSIHAGNCFEVIDRLIQLGVDSRLIASSLRLIVSQRLLAKNCKACLVKSSVPEKFARFFKLKSDVTTWNSEGCSQCRGAGITGRLGVFEFLPIGEAYKELIIASIINQNQIRETALQNGYRSFMGDIRSMLLAGEVSPLAVLRMLGIAPELLGY